MGDRKPGSIEIPLLFAALGVCLLLLAAALMRVIAPTDPPEVTSTAGMEVEPRGNPAAWFTRDSYPPSAVRAGEQGRTVARLDIGPDGKVEKCGIQHSSGSDALDQATCRIALRRGSFEPARDTDGETMSSVYILPVRWQLEE